MFNEYVLWICFVRLNCINLAVLTIPTNINACLRIYIRFSKFKGHKYKDKTVFELQDAKYQHGKLTSSSLPPVLFVSTFTLEFKECQFFFKNWKHCCQD